MLGLQASNAFDKKIISIEILRDKKLQRVYFQDKYVRVFACADLNCISDIRSHALLS